MIRLTLMLLLCVARPAVPRAQTLERGTYLVERISLCNDCHTPRDDKGQLISSKTLQGTPLGIQPIHPMPWAAVAPGIAGLPAHYSEAAMAAFLETGKRPDGSMANPPMPPYRFTHDDAPSIISYLKTLKRE